MRARAGATFLRRDPAAYLEAPDAERLCQYTWPVFHEHDYLLLSEGSDYWPLAEFYRPQTTNCACSAASTAMALNVLAARAFDAAEPFTEQSLIGAVDDADWAARTAENGGGVTFDELQAFLRMSLDTIALPATIRAIAPDTSEGPALEALRAALLQNEASPDSVMLAYYNQTVVTGDPDGALHVSPVGAFDAEADRVLLMDVDRQCHLPYWTPTETFLSSLVTPDPTDPDLAGETGGCVLITLT